MSRLIDPFVFVLATAVGFVANAKADDKSSVRPNVISVPKGPGSITGLGESFDANLNSGSVRETVRIDLPPGTAGLTPSLALAYDSGYGNGALGIGWSLGLSTVQVQTEEGLPRYLGKDRFLLDGAPLVSLGNGVFRLKLEGRFVRVRRVSLSEADHWEVDLPSGNKLTYGRSSEARVEENGVGVFAWYLEQMEDQFGNAVRYSYELDGKQVYLKSVLYNFSDGQAQVSVGFEHEVRPDAVADCRPRFCVVTRKRLKTISVFGRGSLIRRYELSYEEPTGLSQLTAVKMTGNDGQTALPAARFDYSRVAAPVAGDSRTMTAAEYVPAPGGGNDELVDVDGDGFPDLLHTESGSHWYQLNQGGKSFGPQTFMAGSEDPSGTRSPSVELKSDGVEVADLDGDGLPDLLAALGQGSSEADWLYFPNKGLGKWEKGVVFANHPPFKLEDPNVRLVDLDHDKLVDAIQSVSVGSGASSDVELLLWRNQGDGSWKEAGTTTLPDGFPAAGLADPQVKLADMNGDRLIDLAYVQVDGSVQYWSNRGWGDFGPAVVVGNAPFLNATEPNLFLADMNGDGLTDLVQVSAGEVRCWPLVPGERFGTELSVRGTLAWEPSTTVVRLADMNGNGSADVVWSTPGNGIQYLDLIGDVRPNLLVRVENGLGKKLELAYSSSGTEFQKAREAGLPWKNRVPFPVQILAETKLSDSRGGTYVTSYRYADGYYDAATREFRGFSRVTQIDLGETNDPTSVAVHAYDVGVASEALKGREVSVEAQTEAGVPLRRTERTFQTRLYAHGVDEAERVEGAELVREETTLFEDILGGGASSSPAALTRQEWAYDDYGNTLKDAQYGLVVGGDPLAGNDESFATASYANDAEKWILGRPVELSYLNARGDLVARSRHYYDGPAFEGLPLGEMTRGAQTREESWVDAERWVQGARVSRDDYGNVVATLSPRGARRDISYDATHTFPVEERVTVEGGREFKFAATYVGGRGLVDSFTDTNGAVTRFTYDALDRLVGIVKPGDSPELPTQAFRYELANPVSTLTTFNRPRSGETSVDHSMVYFDGLGRALGKAVEAEGEQYVISEQKAYSRRGSVLREWDPYFSPTATLGTADPVSPIVAYAYDALGRRVATSFPDGTRTEWHFGALWSEAWDAEDLDASSVHAGTPTRFEQDGLGRTVRVIERLGKTLLTTRFAFDALGRRISVTNANEQTSRWSYDGANRLVSIVHPDAGMQRFEYDEDGNVLRWFDAVGQQMGRTFDLADRVLTEAYLDAAGNQTGKILYHYDEPSPRLGGGENSTGKLAWVEDLAGEEHFAYDDRGRMTVSSRVVDGKAYRLEQEHDAIDRVVALTYPDDVRLEYRYNSRGLLESVPGVVNHLAYNAQGLATVREYANGIVSTAEYDEHERVSKLEARDKSSRALQQLQYKYDGAGTLLSIQDGVHADSALSGKRSYTYDDLYRLTKATGIAGPLGYSYDPVGNVLQKSDIGTYGYDPKSPNAVSSAGGRAISYDANGAMTHSWGRTFSYDERGELRKVVGGDGGVSEYLYDYEGHRVVKSVTTRGGTRKKVVYIDRFAEDRDGEIVKYVFAGDVRLARVGGGVPKGGTTAATMVSGATAGVGICALGLLWAGLLLSAWGRPQRRRARAAFAFGLSLLLASGCPRPHHGEDPIAKSAFYISDHLGSGELIVGADGVVISEASWDPWGQKIAASAEAYGFADSEWDGEAGLLYLGGRYYDPNLGRFLTVDPVALHAPERALDDPQSLNPYAYARNTPTSLRDRDGHFAHILIGALAGGAIGTGIYLVKGAINGESYTVRGVLAAAASGAVAGGVGAATMGVGLVASGALSSVAGGVIERAVTTGSARQAFDPKVAAMDALTGAATAGLAKGVGAVAKKVVGAVRGRLGGAAAELAEGCGSACSMKGGCFVAGTLVTLANATQIPIEQVQVGDEVVAPPTVERPLERAVFEVVDTPRRVVPEVLDVTVESAAGVVETLNVTLDHPFAEAAVEGARWVPASDLKPGTRLVMGNALGRVLEVRARTVPTAVFNLEVRGAHAYLVGSAETLVHNGTCSGARGGETAATKAGKAAHKNYGTALGEGYETEVTLPSGKRADAVHQTRPEVRELKPDNARAIQRGQKQVDAYARELEANDPQQRTWTGIVDTYKAPKQP